MKKFWFLIVSAYFISRIINLNLIPIFTDEAIYLRWSQIISGDLHYLYLPLTDGKPPLFMWLVALAMKMFPVLDPLIAGRLTSVVLGVLGVFGVFFTGYQLFRNKMVAQLSAFFYLISPFTFFYDRVSHADSLLAAIGTWSLGIGVVLVRTLKLKVAIALGLVIGLGFWTKSPALEFLLLLPVLALLGDFNRTNWRRESLRLTVLFGVVIFVSRAVYELILLFPQSYVISLKNQEFAIPLTQFLKNPFIYFIGNLRALSIWSIAYLTWPMLALLLASMFFGIKQKSFPKLILVIYFFSHFMFMTFFNKIIYPRFLLMFFPLILILVSAGVSDFFGIVKNKLLLIFLITLVSIIPLNTDWKLLTDPVNASIADTDSAQYLNSWSAGFGVNQVKDILAAESFRNKKIAIGVEGTFGLMPYSLELYSNRYPNLEIKPIWPEPAILPQDLSEMSKTMPVYYLVYQREKIPFETKLQLVSKYRQGNSSAFLKLYKVLPNN